MGDINTMNSNIYSKRINDDQKMISNNEVIIPDKIQKYRDDNNDGSNLVELFDLYQRLAKTNDSNAAEVLDLYEEIVESQCRDEILKVYPYNLIKTLGANQDLHLAVRELSRRVMSAVEMDRVEPNIKEIARDLAEELGWHGENNYKDGYQKREGIQRSLLNIMGKDNTTIDEMDSKRGSDIIDELQNNMGQ